MFDKENDLRSPLAKKPKLIRGRKSLQIITNLRKNASTKWISPASIKEPTYAVDYNFSNSVAGVIKKLQLTNFMCHSNFEIEFNPRINFISGVNGSGKSAIQTAIAVGLGGVASKTNRCASISDLIKHNCNAGSVTITLSNTGSNAYKPLDYGQEIKIVRSITSSSSSSYRIYNQWGKLMSNKKQELDAMLYKLKIQPNNPVSILNQDTAKNFLSSNKAENKYAMFKKATLLDEAEAILNNINEQIRDQKERIREKDMIEDHIDEEIRSMDQKMLMVEKLKEAKQRREKLKDEFMWAEVNVYREVLSKLQDSCQEHKTMKSQLEEKRTEIQNEISKNESIISEIKQDLEELQNKSHVREKNIQKYRNEYRERKSRYHEKCEEYQEISSTIKSKKIDQAEIQACLDDIEKEELEHGLEKEQNKIKIAELKDILELNETEEKALQDEVSRLRSTSSELQDKKKRKERNIYEINEEIRENEKRIKSLKTSSDLSIYSPWMPTLVKRIEEAVKRNKFTKPPKGPLGRYIRVNHEQWKNAIEYHLGNHLLSSFFVDNHADRNLLHEIINQVVPSKPRREYREYWKKDRDYFKPTVHCSQFQEMGRSSLLPQIEANNGRNLNLYRALKIDDIVVANFLMDFKSIHQVVLMEDKTECRESMAAQQWIKNCTMILNRNADRYFEDCRYYANRNTAGVRLLQKNVSQHIESLTKKSAEDKKTVEEEKAEWASLKTQLKSTQDELESRLCELLKYHNRISRTKRNIIDLKNIVDIEIPSLKTKLDELNCLEEEIAELQQRKKQMNEDKDRLADEMNQAKETMNEFGQDDSTLRHSQLGQKIEKMEKTIETLRKRIQILDKEIAEENKKIEELQMEIEKVSEQAKDQCTQVSRYSLAQEPLGDDLRSLQEIKEELDEVMMFIEEAEKKLGVESLTFEKKFINKRMAQTRFKNMLSELKKLHNQFKEMSLDRIKTMRSVRDLCENIIYTQFERVVCSRNYRGQLLFNHHKGKLDIQLAPPDSGTNFMNAESLSGGEKSVSTVAFLMALWSNMDLPFYSMDEYDVFMDALNRRTITSLLMSFASEKHSCQFIFLTPLDVSLIQTGPSVSLHRIKKIMK